MGGPSRQRPRLLKPFTSSTPVVTTEGRGWCQREDKPVRFGVRRSPRVGQVFLRNTLNPFPRKRRNGCRRSLTVLFICLVEIDTTLVTRDVCYRNTSCVGRVGMYRQHRPNLILLVQGTTGPEIRRRDLSSLTLVDPGIIPQVLGEPPRLTSRSCSPFTSHLHLSTFLGLLLHLVSPHTPPSPPSSVPYGSSGRCRWSCRLR